MSKEGKVLGEIGRENPFRVPEGYFEHFASELMTRLPEKEKVVVHQPTTWEKVRPWVYMAAMFVGAALIIRVASARYDAAVEVLTDKELAGVKRYNAVANENRITAAISEFESFVPVSAADQEDAFEAALANVNPKFVTPEIRARIADSMPEIEDQLNPFFT